MKKLIRLASIALAFLFIAAVRLSAQDPTFTPIDINTLTPDTIFDSVYEPMYGALVILFGYLSAYIPGVKKLTPFYRVLAFGVVAGLGFKLFGMSFWKIASTFFLSTNLYAVVLKNVFKSPKATVVQDHIDMKSYTG